MMVLQCSRRTWCSRSERVCAGATVTESPVCTPMGSKFSMVQITITLSARSRITSYSYSFQPSKLCSTRTCVVGDASRPLATMSLNSSTFQAIPPPSPPSVKLGRMIAGRPISSSKASASAIVWAIPDFATPMPVSIIACLKRSRSSARSMASGSAPIS